MMSATYEKLVAFDETTKVVRQYLEDVRYSTSKTNRFSVIGSNGVPQDFLKRLAELPVRKRVNYEVEV